MNELIRTNDPVLLSFVSALLSGEGVAFDVFDTNMSIMEGSIGVLPRRVMVANDQFDEAQRILRDNGVDLEPGP